MKQSRLVNIRKIDAKVEVIESKRVNGIIGSGGPREKTEIKNAESSGQVIENTWRKNVGFWPLHDVIEKKLLTDFSPRC
jgi:hypothetical protein